MPHARANARDPKLRAHSRATCARKKKGSVSLTCRRLEGERTIAGAERRRQLRSMLFLGFWNSRSPLPLPSFSSSPSPAPLSCSPRFFYHLPSFSFSSYVFSFVTTFLRAFFAPCFVLSSPLVISFIEIWRASDPAVNVPDSHRSLSAALILADYKLASHVCSLRPVNGWLRL